MSPRPCKVLILQTRKEAPLVTQTTCPCSPGPRSGLTRHSADGLHDKVRKRQVGLPDSFLSVVAERSSVSTEKNSTGDAEEYS